ncbi:hypothetical protein FHR32_006125 [Streptosporangium album]|uniref:Integrase catalytic domain-containing protein n=1 Tax=Streptosporangium album TaxID=47479 RepID=A0A7W7S0P9_9ACTN|nr:hypothetical protein [Streptosporangium album]
MIFSTVDWCCGWPRRIRAGGTAGFRRSCLDWATVTPPRAPKANSICERVIGTLRRELLDHVLVYNEAHALALLSDYRDHYNEHRPHQARQHLPPGGMTKPATSDDRDALHVRRRPASVPAVGGRTDRSVCEAAGGCPGAGGTVSLSTIGGASVLRVQSGATIRRWPCRCLPRRTSGGRGSAWCGRGWRGALGFGRFWSPVGRGVWSVGGNAGTEGRSLGTVKISQGRKRRRPGLGFMSPGRRRFQSPLSAARVAELIETGLLPAGPRDVSPCAGSGGRSAGRTSP